MHPILAAKGRLGPFLLGLVPVWAILTALLARPGAYALGEAVALALPLAILAGFLGLATWYPVRALPPGRVPFPRLVATHAVAAVLTASMWVFLGSLAARLIASLGPWPMVSVRYSAQVPALFAASLLLYAVSVAFHYVLHALEEARAAERREASLKLLAREAELAALRAQIQPHFLFNSLNSIASLAGSEPGRAREMCVRLSDFFRRSLAVGERRSIPLSEELSLTRAYLDVERVRFGPRLEVDEDVDARAESCGVPPLLLQPLVENAVKHGIAKTLEGGYVRVEIRRAGGRLRILVANPADPEAEASRGTGTGLSNVRQRLRARYGENAFFAAKRVAENWLVVISLPVEPGNAEAA
ncbi:MAG TPA: histidine kinase [Thermoanaerobaculia bacterium]